MAWTVYDSKKAKPYLVRWVEDGKRRQHGCATKQEAVLFEAKKIVEMEGKGYSVRRSKDFEMPDFSTVSEGFLFDKEYPRRGDPKTSKTLQGYRSYLDTWVLPIVGTRKVNSFEKSDYEQIYDQAVLAGAARKTKKEALRLTKAVLTHAKGCGYISEVPTHDIDLSPTRREKIKERTEREEKTYTPDEVFTMLAASDMLADDGNAQIRGVWQRYQALTYFLVYTGARIGEARAIRRQDIDFSKNEVRIRQAAPETGPVDLVKTADGIRDVPLHPLLREVLERYLKTHTRHLVFGTSTDNPMSHGNVHRRMLEPLKLKCDAIAAQKLDPRYTPVSRSRAFHAFRHHYASRLVERGADLLTLKTYMGHSSAAFTIDVYSHLFKGQNDEVLTGLVI